jgi:uncharacterized protein YkwD
MEETPGEAQGEGMEDEPTPRPSPWRNIAEARAPTACDADADSLAYINCLRAMAGLARFDRNDALDRAAEAHARYLVVNNSRGHGQREGAPAYFGQSSSDRARRTGYPGYFDVAEVIGYEERDTDALDGLMSAIYHRLALLRFDAGTVGMGRASASGRHAFVALTANPRMAALCRQDHDFSSGRFYRLCEPEQRVPARLFEAAKQQPQQSAPALVAWPAPGSTGIQPAFFEETPDPLPDYSVSGYPISLQANPTLIDRMQVDTFSLTPLTGRSAGEPVAVRRLDVESDPNGQMTTHEIAFMPLERLAWGTRYRVTASFTVDGFSRDVSWEFETRALPGPVTVWDQQGTNVRVGPNRTAYLVIPPPMPDLQRTRWRARMPSGTSVDIETVDLNTFALSIDGPPGSTAVIVATFEGESGTSAQRVFNIVAAGPGA